METTWKLAGFAAAVLVVFALAFGVGRAVGPLDDGTDPMPEHTSSTEPSPGSSPHTHAPDATPGQAPTTHSSEKH